MYYRSTDGGHKAPGLSAIMVFVERIVLACIHTFAGYVHDFINAFRPQTLCSTSIFEVLRFMPPLTCTRDEVDKSLEILDRCLSDEFKN
jgi:acetylornithine/succinyldiaminopimelate/putrescine aminotransferase